ncbi:MAG: hypothetical protein ACJ72G_09815 [Friedmanniella sp.]
MASTRVPAGRGGTTSVRRPDRQAQTTRHGQDGISVSHEPRYQTGRLYEMDFD